MTDGKPKNIFMVVFLVLWSCLFTTKLRCLQKNNIGHTVVIYILWCLPRFNRVLSSVIRKVRKPKVANSPTLPVGHPARLVPIMFFKLAQLILSINIKTTKDNVKKIFIFIFGMQLNTVAQQKHSSFHVTGFLQTFHFKQGIP